MKLDIVDISNKSFREVRNKVDLRKIKYETFKPRQCYITIKVSLFLKNLEDISPPAGSLIPVFWTFGNISSGFKARVGSLFHTWWRCMCYMFPEIHLRCDTTAKLLVANMTSKPFLSTYL